MAAYFQGSSFHHPAPGVLTFLKSRSSRSEIYRACYACFPKQASYGVGPAFVNSFIALMKKEQSKVKGNVLSVFLPRQLRDERDIIWDKLRGCCAECPLCGAKCEGASGHSEPHFVAEKHHVFPAFGGSAVLDSGVRYPSLEMCVNEEESHKRQWKRGGDTIWHKDLDVFLAAGVDSFDFFWQ